LGIGILHDKQPAGIAFVFSWTTLLSKIYRHKNTILTGTFNPDEI
jgi:hypothetical protein